MNRVAKSILILDDDPIFQAVTSALLRRRLGLSVIGATTVESALVAMRVAPELSLIVCDLNLPDVNGIEFIVALAETGRRCPILFVSSAAGIVLRSAEPFAVSLGIPVLATLRKPLDHEIFTKTIEQAMSKGSPD